MLYAIELSQRQSARTLEQAVRHRADILLHPRCRSGTEPIIGHLDVYEGLLGAQTTDRFITAVVDQPAQQGDRPAEPANLHQRSAYPRIGPFADLVGAYCDVTLKIGEHRYVFSADVVSVEAISAGDHRIVIIMSRPKTIQVAQRRSFRRVRLAHSTQVALKWSEKDQTTGGGVGWLCNISKEGLACRAEPRTADRLCIGEQLQVEFTLAADSSVRFLMDAILCSKTPAGSQGKIILGLQFLVGLEHQESARHAEVLQRHLSTWYAKVPDQCEGADA